MFFRRASTKSEITYLEQNRRLAQKCDLRYLGRGAVQAKQKPRFLESGSQNLDFLEEGERLLFCNEALAYWYLCAVLSVFARGRGFERPHFCCPPPRLLSHNVRSVGRCYYSLLMARCFPRCAGAC